MNAIRAYFAELCDTAICGWDRFWFRPTDPATLSLIRICAGWMLFYTHLVWTLDLDGFLGSSARLAPDYVNAIHEHSLSGWSHLFWFSSPSVQWVCHVIALVVFALLTIGWQSRVMSVLAFLFTVSYMHRGMGALFGLDQINVLLSMYLMIGPCGAEYSLDRWLARQSAVPSVSANIAVRLIQVHLCVVYFFAGAGKLQGDTWWLGTAMWISLANYEYQTLDVTWIAHAPWLINILSLFTVGWELTYSVFVWPRLTRPLVLLLAVPVHLGIAFCMGMITFGVAMLIANLAFVSPGITRAVMGRLTPGVKKVSGTFYPD